PPLHRRSRSRLAAAARLGVGRPRRGGGARSPGPRAAAPGGGEGGGAGRAERPEGADAQGRRVVNPPRARSGESQTFRRNSGTARAARGGGVTRPTPPSRA